MVALALIGTFSIVAADPASGEVGVAVQSKYFAVGTVVPWARSGVGAVATQAAGVAVYGPRVLDLMAQGVAPAKALEQALEGDAEKETRQLGVVSAKGEAAAFTGSKCMAWAGQIAGKGFAVQGNILAGEAVVKETARAFEQTKGTLAERMVAALEAGQAAGGDARGQQSAALLVERVGAAKESREGIDRVVDLRVDDQAEPIRELRGESRRQAREGGQRPPSMIEGRWVGRSGERRIVSCAVSTGPLPATSRSRESTTTR